MSVPEWKREENDLNIFITAQEFSVYILQITRNERVFKPIYKTEITDKIVSLAMDIFLNSWKANRIQLGDPERTKYQDLAIDNCIDLLAIWNIAIRAFHLKHKRTDYVVGTVMFLKDRIKKWKANDISRINHPKI